MDDPRWRRLAILSVIVAIGLFVLSPFLAILGAPMELIGALSTASLLALVAAFVLLVGVAARRGRWALTLATIGLVAETAGGLLLLVHEPQPAVDHPEWAWYWPVVNTLYFGGAVVAIAAGFAALLGLAISHARISAVALVLAVAAIIANRLAPYR